MTARNRLPDLPGECAIAELVWRGTGVARAPPPA
jgi:hypothetical protein